MRQPSITLDHGSGGEASRELVTGLVLKHLNNPILQSLDDSAIVEMGGQRLAMTTDSYVVDPLFFPGGDMGSLCIHGTVNDLCMQGARPLYVTMGLILEEGFPLADLDRILASAARAAKEAGVLIIAGDTKVVPRGHADKLFINTSGIGIVPKGVDVASSNARPGDRILINGSIGDHGMTILTHREGLGFEGQLQSDSVALNDLVLDMLETGAPIHVLRDPTRGGVATALNEIAFQSRVGMSLVESDLPVSGPVRAATEILGLDPLYVANEGKCLALVPRPFADQVLEAMQGSPLGKEARIIGEVTDQYIGKVLLKTRVGGTRILPMLRGEPLPRIC